MSSIATTRLPRKAAEARPRVHMDLSHQGHTLSVLPTLVYGDPPVARIEGDAIATLGDEVPVRRHDEERELLRRLRDELNLVPGRRVDLDGTEAIRFAVKLREWQTRVGDDWHAVGFATRRASRAPAGSTPAPSTSSSSAIPRTARRAPPKRAEAAAVLRAWRDGLDLVPLQGGGWAPLPADWLAKHGHLVADLLAARGADKGLSPAALPTIGALCDALDAPTAARARSPRAPLRGLRGHPRGDAPRRARRATLRVYQRAGRRLALVSPRRRARRACSPTTWVSARRSRPSACFAGGRSSFARRASSTTGPTRSPASGRAFVRPSTTARGASSTRPPT